MCVSVGGGVQTARAPAPGHGQKSQQTQTHTLQYRTQQSLRERESLLLIYLLALQLGHCFLHTNNIMWVSLPQQLLALASTFHKASILLFGYFVPALSSVKGMRIE